MEIGKKAIQFALIPILLVVSTITLHAQLDSISYVNAYRHEINEAGQRTANKKIIWQRTYNSEWQQVLTLHYSDTNSIDRYTYYFYEDSLLISSETYTIDQKIDTLRQFLYDDHGLKISENFYRREKGKLQLESTVEFTSFRGARVPAAIMNSKGKWIKRSQYEKTENGYTINSKYRKNSRDDQLKSEQLTYFSGQEERTDSVHVLRQYYNGKSEKLVLIYSYASTHGKPVGINTYDSESGQLLRSTEFLYMANGLLRGRGFKDSEGKYLKYLSFEYKKHATQMTPPEPYKFGSN